MTVLIENGDVFAEIRQIIDNGQCTRDFVRKHRLHKVQNDVRIGRAEHFQNVVVRYRIARVRGAHIRNRKTVAHAALGRSCDKVSDCPKYLSPKAI